MCCLSLQFPGKMYAFDRVEFRMYATQHAACPPPSDEIDVDYDEIIPPSHAFSLASSLAALWGLVVAMVIMIIGN